MKRKALVLASTLGIVLALLIGWRFFNIARHGAPQAKGKKTRSTGKQPVGVQTITKRVLQHEFDQVGSVESSQTVNVVAKTAGPIIEINVRQGDAVKRGQVLARVDPAQARANLYKKKSDLANAQFTYYQQSAQQGLTNVQASSGVSIAQADLSAARAGVQKSQSVFKATLTQGRTTVAQSHAKLVGAQAQERQAKSNYAKSKAKYERMLELQRQGFASNADLQDSYQDVLAQYAALQLQSANVKVAQSDITNAAAQAHKDTTSAFADIQTSRFTQVSKAASLAEAEAGTSKTQAYQQQLLAQQAQVNAAEADLRAAELSLQDTVLRSPVDGFVSDRKLDPGALASVGSIIVTVQSGGQVWVVSPLPQELYSRVKTGLPCVVSVDGVNGKTFPAKVFSKDPAVDAASRQFNVRVTIEDPTHLVKPGMFARLRIKLGTVQPRLTVPNSALKDQNDAQRTATVYTVVDKEVHAVVVSLGFSDSFYTVVKSGLKEGDTVITESLGNFKEGQKVDPVEVTPTPYLSPSPSGTP